MTIASWVDPKQIAYGAAREHSPLTCTPSPLCCDWAFVIKVITALHRVHVCR